jgi:hypothetical protein
MLSITTAMPITQRHLVCDLTAMADGKIIQTQE